MGHMVVELEIMVDDCVICMVELEKVFQSAGLLLVLYLDIVYWDWFEVNCVPGVASKEAGQTEWMGEGCEGREHDRNCELELDNRRKEQDVRSKHSLLSAETNDDSPQTQLPHHPLPLVR